ncbi:MAG: hypothetical protein KY469_16535 [Actinobacteria bacterium]|nr:hypothetical protein [Actinomycetota bacterium]
MGATVWWLGLLVVLAVVLAIAYLAHQVTRNVAEIRRYSQDILEHGVGLAGELDPVPLLGRTRELVVTVADAFRQLVQRLAPRI